MAEADYPPSDRDRFGIHFGPGNRDRRVAAWIDWLITDGRNASEIILNILDEIITGRSSVTGRVMAYQGDETQAIPDADDPVIQALLEMDD